MQKPLFTILLLFSLFPIGMSFSQTTDKEYTLAIELLYEQPFSLKDEDGYTVIFGEVKNLRNIQYKDVKIWAGFYNDSGTLLESTVGTTILGVIPSEGTLPFKIKSESANAAITNISVKILSFNSSTEKQELLKLEPGKIKIESDHLKLSGTIDNNGELNSENTKIHLIIYDGFQPPRVIGLETIVLENDLISGSDDNFEFVIPIFAKAFDYTIISESNNYLSNFSNYDTSSINPLTKLVTISDVGLLDSKDNKLSSSDIFIGTKINIQSGVSIQYSTDPEKSQQPYSYYVQVKKSGHDVIVEFVGKSEGSFNSAEKQFPIIEWIPEHDGLFFIETYVWDDENVAISSPGPITLIHVQPQ